MKTSDVLKNEIAIGFTKEVFARLLMQKLELAAVNSPLFLNSESGLNDDLNGIENPVSFNIKNMPGNYSVIQSLAKWKRLRLKELDVPVGQGIITDMRALRPDDQVDEIHSVYVDQWDWEKVIEKEQRTEIFLAQTVYGIYSAIKHTEMHVCCQYPEIKPILPEKIEFIHARDLFERYPEFTPKERENLVAKEFGAVFIRGIGNTLPGGSIHDGRAPDYDDWMSEGIDGYQGLNGDIIVWNPILSRAFEISSMGIRVDEKSLLKQLKIRNCMNRATLPYHQMLLNGELPLTIGGGIGQSRLAMFLLRKQHIKEVQQSCWPESVTIEKNCRNL